MKPSVEVLKDVKLRPIFQSLPSPREGHSPTLPPFRVVPQYYGSLAYEEESKAFDLQSPTYFSLPSTIPDRRISPQGAIFYTVTTNMGLGYLCIPYGIHRAGIIPGSVLFLAITLVNSYSATYLLRSIHVTSCQSYPDLVDYSFGTRGRQIFFIIFYIQICLEFFLYQKAISYSLYFLMPRQQLFCDILSIFSPIIVNLLSTSNTVTLAIMNIISTSLVLFLYVLLMIISTIIIVQMSGAEGTEDIKNDFFNYDLTNLVNPLGVICFAFRNASLSTPTVISNINTHRANLVIYCSLIITTITYLIGGIVGAITYTSLEAQINQKHSILNKLLFVCLLLLSLTRYSLIISTFTDDSVTWIRELWITIKRILDPESEPIFIEDSCVNNQRYVDIISIVIRVLTTVIIRSLVPIVPTFYQIMSIIGIISCTGITIIFPFLIHEKLFRLGAFCNNCIIIVWIALAIWSLFEIFSK